MNRTRLLRLASIAAARGKLTIAAALLLASAAVATALACGWSLVTDHSVRFNTYRTGRAFYRLPPLPIMVDDKTRKELSVREAENFDYEEVYYQEDDASKAASRADKAWADAQAAVQAGDLHTVEKYLHSYLEETGLPTTAFESGDPSFRNAAFDMLDALSNLRRGAGPEAVRRYLEARLALTNGQIPESGNITPADKVHPNLKDNWAYLDAALFYIREQKTESLAAFRKHANTYPHSEKAESVRYMIAKLTMEKSHSFGNMNCGIMGKRTWREEEIGPESIEPVEKCRDENWQAAIDEFQRIIRDYPQGRYVSDARGWLGYLHRRGSERAEALAEYYRLLGHPSDRAVRLEAKKSLQMIGHEYDDATLDKVEELIANDADAALAYSYHRIYNHAVDFSYEETNRWCCSDDATQRQDEQEEKRRVAAAHQTGRHELERIARFATAMMKRHPKVRVSGAFALRVAQAHLELQNYPDARGLSQKALSLGLKGDLRAEALWVEGSARHQLKEYGAARTIFDRLVDEFPGSKLTEGARRLSAMTAEDQGDLEEALDIYLDLGYDTDVAYFIDVLFPTNRLARYVEARRGSPHFNQLLYALGVRYMRDRRWNDARKTLRAVKSEEGSNGYVNTDPDATWHFAKEPIFDYGKYTFIKTSWVMQDLKTIDILERREDAVEAATGDEAKAEALYQLASAYFEADDLAFYNPAIWNGARAGSLSELGFSDRERMPGETQIIFEHLQTHDPWARAIPIYEQIVTRFPHTRAAPDALYSTAVAHEQLENRISAWKAFYGRGLFAGSRKVRYTDVKAAYPIYQLPRGTNGWEPSTRTVNGGPGWAAKPKPAPKLTRTQKFERRLKYASEKLRSGVAPWLNSGTAAVSAIFSGWITMINTSLSWALTAIGLLLGAYLLLLAVHFRSPLLAAARRLGGPETAGSQFNLGDPGSRVEMVIEQKEPTAGQ